MNVSRDKIVKFCEEYLSVNNFQDYCINGLQVEGVEKVERIVTGVSLSKRLIEAAIAKNAQMLLVHHGIFIRMINENHQIQGVMRNRLKLLLENDINLVGFHLPIDAHPIIGNNISLCRLFGLNRIKPISVGFYGELNKKIELKEFVKTLDRKLEIKSFVIEAGYKNIKRVAFISGGSASRYPLVSEKEIDLFVAGELSENHVREIEESKINFIAAGHYNTEKLGIQNLGKLIAKKFRVAVEFVDVPNDV